MRLFVAVLFGKGDVITVCLTRHLRRDAHFFVQTVGWLVHLDCVEEGVAMASIDRSDPLLAHVKSARVVAIELRLLQQLLLLRKVLSRGPLGRLVVSRWKLVAAARGFGLSEHVFELHLARGCWRPLISRGDKIRLSSRPIHQHVAAVAECWLLLR